MSEFLFSWPWGLALYALTAVLGIGCGYQIGRDSGRPRRTEFTDARSAIVIQEETPGQLFARCHDQAAEMGWHDNPREVGTQLMLIVSEISEAMEGWRKGLDDDHLPHRKMTEVELADAVIRCADLAGFLGLDLYGAIHEKLEYNRTRADHQPQNRAKAGGKKW